YRSDGERLPTHQLTTLESLALSAFAQYFFGGQMHHCMGSYLSANDHVMIESCTVIKAYTLDVESYETQIFALADEIAAILEQECVLLTIIRLDGMQHLVKHE